MGRNRKKKVAVVQCTGGCRRAGDIPDPERYGDCRQAVLEHPDSALPVGLHWSWKLRAGVPAGRYLYQQIWLGGDRLEPVRGMRAVCEGLSPGTHPDHSSGVSDLSGMRQ